MNTIIPLHDVRDVRGFIMTKLQRSPAFNQLRWADKEEAISAMIEVAFVLSMEYDTNASYSFSVYLHRRITNRFIDWMRTEYGDTRYKNNRQQETLATADENEYIWDVPTQDPVDTVIFRERMREALVAHGR